MKSINSNEFVKEVLESREIVMVDFWAEWCGPCRRLSPILEEIAGERKDIKICKINVDENRDLAIQYEIRTIPSLLFFKNGKRLESRLESFDKKEVNKEIDRILKNSAK